MASRFAALRPPWHRKGTIFVFNFYLHILLTGENISLLISLESLCSRFLNFSFLFFIGPPLFFWIVSDELGSSGGSRMRSTFNCYKVLDSLCLHILFPLTFTQHQLWDALVIIEWYMQLLLLHSFHIVRYLGLFRAYLFGPWRLGHLMVLCIKSSIALDHYEYGH